MEVLNDRSISIRDSVIDVQETLAIAIALVILVIFLFLRSASATIIPALAVPISLIATCAAMYAFGFSINNMTLLALTLSVGFVVDDAIVMLENIVRHIEGGMRPFEAALKGAREIGFTIISITFSLIAVFIPVLLMGGMVGRVFREFAVTIAVAIVLSGFVSLTLTPMLCARVLKAHHEDEKQNVVLRDVRGDVPGLAPRLRMVARQGARPQVDHADRDGRDDDRHGWLYIVIPKGFFPTEDTGFIAATVEGPSDISFKAMFERQQQIAEIVRKDTAVVYVNSTVGIGGPNPTNNYGRMFIALKPKSERGENSTAVIQRLRRSANAVTGMVTYFQNVQNINITGRISKSEYQYTLQSSDIEALYPGRAGTAREDRRNRRPARRHHRSLHQESADDGRNRPREGGGLRHHGRSGSSGTVQRLRHAPGGDDLHAVQRLPGDPGKPAGIPDRSVRPVEDLRQDERGRRRAEAWARRGPASPATAFRRDRRSRSPP